MKRIALGVVLVLGACPARDDAPAQDDLRAGDDASDVTPAGGDLVGEHRAIAESPRIGAAGLCDGVPADLDGQLVWVDAAGLWHGPARGSSAAPQALDTWLGGELAASPVVDPRGASGASLYVSLTTADGCELRTYGADGARRAVIAHQGIDCASPALSGNVLAWAVREGETSGSVVWVGTQSATVVTATALSARPTTGVKLLGGGSRMGGGSHWVVGTADGVVVLKDSFDDARLEQPRPIDTFDAPLVVATWAESEGLVTSVQVLGEMIVATLAGPNEGDGEGDLGRRLRMLEFTSDSSLTSHGVIEVPGPMTAHPLLVTGCESVAGGGSHWTCPGGPGASLLAAGDGWLGAWSVPSGEPLFRSVFPIVWSGLAVGEGGWVAGGGSHWRPGDPDSWAVLAFDPMAPLDPLPTPLANGSSTAACVASPVWYGDGAIHTTVQGADPVVLERAMTPALGLGQGMARPLGDNHNRGQRYLAAAAVTSACSDGVVRSLEASAIPAKVSGVVSHDAEIVAFGGGPPVGGIVRWSTDDITTFIEVPEAGAVEQALVRGSDDVVLAWRPRGSDAPTFEARRRSGTVRWAIQPFGVAHRIAPIVESTPGVLTVGGAALTGSDVLARISADDGAYMTVAFTSDQSFVGLVDLVPRTGGGAVMVLDTGTVTILRGVDDALATVALVEYRGSGLPNAPVMASVDGAGQIRLAVRTTDAAGTERFRLLRYDAALALVDDRALPEVRALATAPDGSSLAASSTALFRIGPGGELGLPHAFPEGLQLSERPLALRPEGYVVAWRRTVGATLTTVIGRADALGFLDCSAAGLCAGTESDACDVDQACLTAGCDAATGECREASASGCE